MFPDDPARAALAQDAAFRCLSRRTVRPGARLAACLLAEAAAAPAPPRALDLTAEVEALCAALQQAVRRRSWLYFAPADAPLPVAVPRLLLQCSLLCFVQGVLQAQGAAVVQVHTAPGAAVLVIKGGRCATLPRDARALLLRLAAVSGGAVVQSGGAGAFSAAVRLPKSSLPLRAPCQAQDYLYDRFSPLYTLLGRQCAGYGEELGLRS